MGSCVHFGEQVRFRKVGVDVSAMFLNLSVIYSDRIVLIR